MSQTFVVLGTQRLLNACAALLVSFTTTMPAAAFQWDRYSSNDINAGSAGGESALQRTRVSQQPLAQTLSPGAHTRGGGAIPTRRAESAGLSLPHGGRAATVRTSTSGGPDIFGSVTLPIRSVPYDNVWRQLSATNAHGLGHWTGSLTGGGSRDPERLLQQVNALVNQRINYVEDQVAGAPSDLWQRASLSLRSGRGDCEDYALAKHGLLAALGFDRDDLYLVLVRDLVARRNHAVLAVRLGERFVILDSATDDLLDGDLANNYQPIFSYSAAGRWIHGYPFTPQPPVRIAASTIPISPGDMTASPRRVYQARGRGSR